MKLPPARWSPAALTELLTVKKQCKRIFHGNEWMKELKTHIIMLYKTTIHVLVCKVGRKTVYFVISISAVNLKLRVKITSIFGSYRFLTIVLHDIFSLSHHPLASWNLYIPRVAASRRKWSSSRQVKCLDESKALELKSNPQVNHRAHLKDYYVSKIW